MTSPKPSRSAPSSRPLARVDVRPSLIHGLGAFARVDLAPEQSIGVYTGRRHAAHVVRPHWDGQVTYLSVLSDGTLIDGGHGGNATRHINHSCEPNVEAVEVRTPQGRLRITIRTRRAVEAGEELLLDYALDIVDEDASAYPCRCGTVSCRGSMAAVA